MLGTSRSNYIPKAFEMTTVTRCTLEKVQNKVVDEHTVSMGYGIFFPTVITSEEPVPVYTLPFRSNSKNGSWTNVSSPVNSRE